MNQQFFCMKAHDIAGVPGFAKHAFRHLFTKDAIERKLLKDHKRFAAKKRNLPFGATQ